MACIHQAVGWFVLHKRTSEGQFVYSKWFTLPEHRPLLASPQSKLSLDTTHGMFSSKATSLLQRRLLLTQSYNWESWICNPSFIQHSSAIYIPPVHVSLSLSEWLISRTPLGVTIDFHPLVLHQRFETLENASEWLMYITIIKIVFTYSKEPQKTKSDAPNGLLSQQHRLSPNQNCLWRLPMACPWHALIAQG